MRYKFIIVLLLMGSIGTQAAETQSPHYFFPFVNPYEATVIPLPAAYKEKLDDKISIKTFHLDVFPDRKVPDVFWYQRGGLTCSLAAQDFMAPMLFI